MKRQLSLQSYELLVTLLTVFEETSELNISALEDIGNKLDSYFGTKEFLKLQNSIKNQPSDNSDESESLFINYSGLELQYFDANLLNERERLLIYTCIQGWFKQYSLTPEENKLLIKALLLEDNICASVENFFSSDNRTILFGRHELFVLSPASPNTDDLEGEWIDNNMPPDAISHENHFVLKKIKSPIQVLYLDNLKLFLITSNELEAALNKSGERGLFGWNLLLQGDTIEIEPGISLDYHELKSRFLARKYSDKLHFNISNLSFFYPNNKGINSFSLKAEPGLLVGLLGTEGCGKTTLLKLLAGEINSTGGDIFINGYSLKKDLYHLKGMIGYVPEDDLLHDELTVYENLFLTAKLYLGKTSGNRIEQKVNRLLNLLELNEYKNQPVGTIYEKKLQPGQRRLLNIALELIRDPQILIVDNAITPLSLSDSSKIINVLARLTFNGRIVFTSITQTSQESFKLFDKIFILDEGGFPVYFGRSHDAPEYFSGIMQLDQKIKIESAGPDTILNLISKKKKHNNHTTRILTPSSLYKEFTGITNRSRQQSFPKKVLPENILQPPSLDRQYVIFNYRNFRTKFARSRELIFTIAASPVLALLLSILLRKSTGNDYSFSLNQNVPQYFFISIIIALFMGLVQAANEVFKERQINNKQQYLNLSRFSYINSKITYLFTISIIQSFFFVVIGNGLLEIRGMLLIHWLIIFSCQAFGLLTGLIFSSTVKSLSCIFSICIPIILLLQILLGGGYIELHKYNYADNKYTPLASDFMISRWAYESLMVYQYKKNAYNREFYEINRDISSGRYNSLVLIPLLQSQLTFCIKREALAQDTLASVFSSLQTSLNTLSDQYEVFGYENLTHLNVKDYNADLYQDAMDYLEYLYFFFSSMYEVSMASKNQLIANYNDSLGSDYLTEQKKLHYNFTLNDIVKRKPHEGEIQFQSGIPIRISEPVYQYPISNFGRAQMFLPQKKFNSQLTDTTEFNISIIWIMNLTLYILLISGLFGLEYKIFKF